MDFDEADIAHFASALTIARPMAREILTSGDPAIIHAAVERFSVGTKTQRERTHQWADDLLNGRISPRPAPYRLIRARPVEQDEAVEPDEPLSPRERHADALVLARLKMPGLPDEADPLIGPIGPKGDPCLIGPLKRAIRRESGRRPKVWVWPALLLWGSSVRREVSISDANRCDARDLSQSRGQPPDGPRAPDFD